MGKSTAAQMFVHLGVPSHDADAAVHRLMVPKGRAYKAIICAFPYFSYPDIYTRKIKGVRFLDRKKLGKLVFENKIERTKLEHILHPLVREDQAAFIKAQKVLGRKIVVLDIPLLFETDAQNFVDYTVCVSAPYHIQRTRVLARTNMNEEKFQNILKAQMPDAEKRARCDYLIHSGLGMARTMMDIKAILRDIKIKERRLDALKTTKIKMLCDA